MAFESFALFDVLGFRQAILDQPLHDVRDRMFRFFYILRSATLDRDVVDQLGAPPTYQQVIEGDKACKFHQFSDSILLRAKNETERDAEALIHATRMLLAIGAVQGTLLRGALCHGELEVVLEMNLYLGRGLVEAYNLEQNQDWSGCVVHPRFVERWPGLVGRMRQAEALVSYPAPMKSGTYEQRLCVNWASKVVGDLEDILVGPAGIPQPGVSWNALRKLKNTVDFFGVHRGQPGH